MVIRTEDPAGIDLDTVNSCDGGALVVPSEEEEVFWVFYLPNLKIRMLRIRNYMIETCQPRTNDTKGNAPDYR